MTEDEKIQEKLMELNGGKKGPWFAVDGYHALIAFSFPSSENNGVPQFNPSSGVPAKVFINGQSGEIKIFSGFIFRN